MMPLCTSAISPWLMCGCALSSVTPPWVAQGVADAQVRAQGFGGGRGFHLATRPVRRTRLDAAAVETAMPAES